MQEIDRILLSRTEEINEYLQRYTIALTFTSFDGLRESYINSGTGILVNLWGARFILTAGHCVAERSKGSMLVQIATVESRFEPRMKAVDYEDDSNSKDWGYFRLSEESAEQIRASTKVFASHKRLIVSSRAQAQAIDDCYIIGGFPSAIGARDERVHRPGFYLHVGVLAGNAGRPAPFLRHRGLHYVDLLFRKNEQIRKINMDGGPDRLTSLAGASGGGCWKSNARLAANWTAELMQLWGIHTGTFSRDFAEDDEDVGFAREVSIGHVLKLIARDDPELGVEIFREWPILSETTEDRYEHP